MARIRVLVVEDSATVRARLIEVLRSEESFEVVGAAENGREGIELCRALRPDVVTMDMMMPEMTGLSATEYIMAYCPTPILIVSSSVNRGELFKTYEALAAGALDVLEKPTGEEPPGVWESGFLSSVRVVSRVRVITHPRARMLERQGSPPARSPASDAGSARSPCRIVAIGASTGGPGAIVEILRGIPPGFDLPIVFVLHINATFGTAFAEWLDGQSPHRVSYATDGESLALAAGRVVMAPPDRHLVIHNGRFRINRDPERHSCRPSVDTLFESVAREYGPSASGYLLTGMGRDGAAGLLEIRRAGGRTVAQDEASSVVYGMPHQAALLNAAERILPLSEIGPAITEVWHRQQAEPVA